MISGEALVALGQSLEQGAEVDIDFSGPLDTAANRLEGFGESGR